MSGGVASVRAGDPERLGRYRIVGRLGGGGMGTVFLALSPGGRAVAVKVVRAELAEDAGFRRRFVREVEAARQVSGFFTAAVVDADPEGTPPWLATEYVPGVSLEAAVAAYGAWPEGTVLALGAALAEALESVHAAGVVHRDLKPSNVLLAADGPRVIDFGIARAAEATELTETGMVVGTPGFIAPEQLVADEVTAAGDVFALGAVLVFAATGTGPFGAGHAHALNYRVVHEEPELTGVPPALADVAARCLARDPARRPSVPGLVGELSRLAGTGQAAGFFTEAGWLPAPVAAEVLRVRSAPLLPPPGAPVPPGVLGPPGAPVPGGPARAPGPARRRILAAVAAAAAVVLAIGAVVLAVRLSGADGKAEAAGPPQREELWTFPLAEGMRLTQVIGGTAYIDDLKGGLHALNTENGRPRWKHAHPLDEDVPTGPQFLGATESVAYYAAGEYTYARDAGSGEELWKWKDHGIHPSVAMVGERIYTSDVRLIARDSRTGREIWRNTYEGFSKEGPTVSGGVAFVVINDGTLRAVDAETGADLWRLQVGDQLETSPVAANGVVYYGVRDGSLHAVNAATGRYAWKQSFEGASWDPAIAGGAGAPIIADGVAYFENDGYVCAFAADTGKPLWRHKTGVAEARLLSVEKGTVLFSDGDDEGAGNLYALDVRDGTRLWKEHLGGSPSIVDGRAVENGTVLFSDGDDEGAGNLYALDVRDGTRLWKEHLGGSPRVIDGRLYVVEDDLLRVLSDAG
ncbi:PQQ-binding-like beta-propeller repeat protein [Actinomadura sp. 6K520]|uniref:serine/threonine-protein kinase n=1 Tax=Actinomadura sp. 6K520 TaxID=2530364 RepID=UPI0014048663|nr:PQQ-binding-like beta-propeller repeat protein [Actinomadura sp. 6K520]